MRPDIARLPVGAIGGAGQVFIPYLALVVEIFRVIAVLQRSEIEKEPVGVGVMDVENIPFVFPDRGGTFQIEKVIEIEIVQQEEGAVMVGVVAYELVRNRRLGRYGFDGGVGVG